jgi:X-Pro dipeptidyl-peptidase (S15 family)
MAQLALILSGKFFPFLSVVAILGKELKEGTITCPPQALVRSISNSTSVYLCVKAMVVRVTPSDPFVETPTGLPSPMALCWLHYVSGHVNQLMEAVDWERVYEHLPLITMDERAGRRIPFWHAEIEHPQLDDFWAPLLYQDKFDQVDVPVLHISGWYGDEQIGTPL